MSFLETQKMCTTRCRIAFSRPALYVAAMTWLLMTALCPLDAGAQLPMPAATPFEMTGFIQKATLAGGSDPFRGGTITLNNHEVTVPRNTIFQMPATSLTWAELFLHAPAPYGPTQTGLAIADSPTPAFTFEVTVQGNRVGNEYIAGLLFIDQLSLQTHQGFINYIDYTVGEMRVGGTLGVADGTRVRINDPIGRFGRAGGHDKRFTIDEDNPTIKSETGFPMCLPRVNPAVADDALCPHGNRPGTPSSFQRVFTMPSRPAPTGAERANPAARATPDPWRMAPFVVGDYVTVKGPIVIETTKQADGSDQEVGQYIDAWGIDANVGIFTTPGTLPAYVAIDVLLMGTGPLDDPAIAQEGAKRTRVEGFTTDISTAIMISAVDVNACTGEEVDRPWNLQAVDPGPPNGAVAGRWRFRPGAPLFDLKGFPFLPPTREVHAVSAAGIVTTLNGLSAGEYQAPNFEFILPENRGIGNPKVAANFEAMPFLTMGSGPRAAFATGQRLGYVSQLSPWPGAPELRPVRNACAPIAKPVVPSESHSGDSVTLDGSESEDANTPASPLTFKWTQTAGTAVVLSNATSTRPTFKAPTLTTGAPPMTLTFELAVNNGTATTTSAADVIVIAPPDTTKPTIGNVTVVAGSLTRKSNPMSVQVIATDPMPGSGLQSVVFNYTYPITVNGLPQTASGVIIGALKAGTTNTWTGTFTPSVTAQYTFTATATDKAANAATSATPAKISVQ